MPLPAKPSITPTRLLILSALFITLFLNLRFYINVLEIYPPEGMNLVFIASLALVFGIGTLLLLGLVCWGPVSKPLLTLVLLVSSQTAYFMDTYNVIIDDNMIINVLETDPAEAGDLLSWKQGAYLLFLGILPSLLIWRVRIVDGTPARALLNRVILLGGASIIAVATILSLGGYYSAFIREHKTLRFFSNPSYVVYSISKVAAKRFSGGPQSTLLVGLDAKTPSDDPGRDLVIMVLGETARSDHFSLNGYERETNPQLAREEVFSFREVASCGTSTAESVPCMFSIFGRDEFDKERAHYTENVLDVMRHAGINVFWLDNNAGSKGVAKRTPFQSYRSEEINPVCNPECRDEGMLAHLQEYIDDHPKGDLFIVLHQMGNHGPAYHKRYPESFARFQPVCTTNQLEDCSDQEISNAYDNALLYTDDFLRRTIDLLKQNDADFETAMLYVSDHGESLGENGLYLHGMPYLLAPKAQKHVPMILWFGEQMKQKQDLPAIRASLDHPYSHDNLFHTLLGLFDVDTQIYRKDLDLLAHDAD